MNILYPVTPTASVEADQDKVKEVCVMADEIKPVGIVGAVVSETATVVTVNAFETALLLMAASYAETVNEYKVEAVKPVTL